MAASIIPAPGTRVGPCIDSCEHIDCAAYRRMAAHTCRLCGKGIGYGVRYYWDPEANHPEIIVHATCLEDQVDAKLCPTCKGHGANPMSDNLNWLPCTECQGSGNAKTTCP